MSPQTSSDESGFWMSGPSSDPLGTNEGQKVIAGAVVPLPVNCNVEDGQKDFTLTFSSCTHKVNDDGRDGDQYSSTSRE